jgi:hypothetical protein
MSRRVSYLLHFIDPVTGEPARYKHAGHYLGNTETDRLAERVQEHRDGRGAVLTAAARAAGLDFVVTRTWPGGRLRERQLKTQSGARYCPDCSDHPRPASTVRGGRYLTRRQRQQAAQLRQAEPPRRRALWELERDGTWLDGTPVPMATTYAEAAQYRAAVQQYGTAIDAERAAALDELERRWTEQEEPVNLRDAVARAAEVVRAQTKGRAEAARAVGEADRLWAIADELERQTGPRPNYAREITAERAARMRERLGEDLVQDARTQSSAEARSHEPELQDAERDAEIDRLADAFPEPGIGGTTGIALSALSDLVPADGPAPQSGREPAEPLFGPRPDGTYADAIDSDIAARAGGAEQLAAAQPDLSAEEIQAFQQAERERWAQVDRETEYAARQAAQYYGPEMADLLGIEAEDAVQAPDSPGWEFGDDVATWSPALEGVDPDAEVSDFPYLTERPAEPAHEPGDGALHDRAAYAEAVRQAEARALARQHIAQEEHDAAGVAAAREEANAARRARLATQAEAYEAAVALQEDAVQADQEQAEGDPVLAAPSEGDLWDLEAGRAREHLGRWTAEHGPGGGYAESLRQDVARYEQWAAEARASAQPAMSPEAASSPEATLAAATQPAGTPHTGAALAERGWQADSHGVYTRNPDAEAPGAHCGLAGYEAGAPDHMYGSPQCAEADPEGAHFGRGPGEPMDTGRWPVLQADYGCMYIGPQAQAEAG